MESMALYCLGRSLQESPIPQSVAGQENFTDSTKTSQNSSGDT